MDHTSIMKFIADNWGLLYLTNRAAQAGDLTTALRFGGVGTVVSGVSLAVHTAAATSPVIGWFLVTDRVRRGENALLRGP